MKDNDLDYFQYLQTRTKLGLFYRLKFYYPKVRKRLKGKILDYGCGIGDMLGFLKDGTGVDINSHCVAHCRSLNLQAFPVGEDNQIPFPDNSFDSVLMDNVLEHINDPIPLIKEIKRVLNVGGNLVIGVPGILGYSKDPDHKIFYDRKKLTQLICSDNDFEVKEFFATPFRFFWASNLWSRFSVFGNFTLVNKFDRNAKIK